MNKLLIIFVLSNISFYSFGMFPIPDSSLLFSTVSPSRNMEADNQNADSKIIDLITAHASLSPIQKKGIFDFINQLSGRDYIKLLNKVIDIFHENSSFSENQMGLLLFPDLLEISESLGNKDLFLVFNYKNKNVQSLKNRILKSEKISKSLKDKMSSCLSYKEKLRAYEAVEFEQGIIPEILPTSDWDISFRGNSSSLSNQKHLISSFSSKLKNIVELLEDEDNLTENQIQQISLLAPQMLLDFKNLMKLTPPSDLKETKQLEEFFSSEAFPLIQKAQSILFEIHQKKLDNQTLDNLYQNFFKIEYSQDSYLVDYAVCQELLKKQSEKNSSSSISN